jgi:hypothetical protein
LEAVLRTHDAVEAMVVLDLYQCHAQDARPSARILGQRIPAATPCQVCVAHAVCVWRVRAYVLGRAVQYANNHLAVFLARISTSLDWTRVRSKESDLIKYLPTLYPGDSVFSFQWRKKDL